MNFQHCLAMKCSSDTMNGGHLSPSFQGGAGDEQYLGFVDPTKSIVGIQCDDRLAGDGLMAKGEDGAVNRGPPLPNRYPEYRPSVVDDPDCLDMIPYSCLGEGAMDAVPGPDHGGCWSAGISSMALSPLRDEGVFYGAVNVVSSHPLCGVLDTTYTAIRNEALETVWNSDLQGAHFQPQRSGSNPTSFEELSDSELPDSLFDDSPCGEGLAPTVRECGDAEDMDLSGGVLEGLLKPMGLGRSVFQFQEVNPHVQEPPMDYVEWDNPIPKHSKEVKVEELCERLGAHAHPRYEYFLIWATGKRIVCDEPREAQPPYKRPRPNTTLATGVRIKLILTIVLPGAASSRLQELQLYEEKVPDGRVFVPSVAERGSHSTVTFEVDNKSFLEEHPGSEDRDRRIVLLDRGEVVREYHFRAYESNGSVPQRIQPQKRRRRICGVPYSTRPKRSRDEAGLEPEDTYNKRQCISTSAYGGIGRALASDQWHGPQ